MHKVEGLVYQLANTYCDAVGSADTPTCGSSATVNVLTLTKGDGSSSSYITPASEAPIVGLVDGQSYIVTQQASGHFKLEDPATLAIENISAGGSGGSSTFSIDGLGLTDKGKGAQELIFPLTAGSGTQQMVGIGTGIPFAASSGDGVISASATGGGGGVISVSDAESDASNSPTLSTTIGDGANLTAGEDISVTTHGFAYGKGISSNDSGGLISVNTANSHVELSITNTVSVDDNASLTAQGSVAGHGDVTVDAYSFEQPVTIASSGSGGLFAGGGAGTSATAAYDTETNVDGSIDAAAQRANVMQAWHNDINGANVTITADVGGLGVAANTSAKLDLGEYYNGSNDVVLGTTLVDIKGDSSITGNHVNVIAAVDRLNATLSTRTHAGALGGSSTADGTINVGGSTNVKLESGSSLIGNVNTVLDAEYSDIDLHVTADASCSCLGGVTDSTADLFDNTDARVSGFSGSTIKTSDLTVETNQNVVNFNANAPNSGGFLDFGNGGDTNYTTNLNRDIFWETRVIMLGEPNPELDVDANGNITKIVNVTVSDSNGDTYSDNPFTDTHTVGQLVGTTFTVDDIIYDHGAQARFLANNLSNVSGAPGGNVWGDLGDFEFQQTWDYVKLLNASPLNMVVNAIDVVDTANSPLIDIRVDNIQDDGADVTYSSSSPDPGMPGSTFDFNIKYTFPPTLVLIKNTIPFSGVTGPYIQLNSYIENPIGTTDIENSAGDIKAGGPPHPSTAIIRTNVLVLNAPQGSIGARGPPEPTGTRNPISVELVRYEDVNSTIHDPVVMVDAGKDVVLDLTADDRADSSVPTSMTITIDHIFAGDDVDVVINDSKAGTDQASLTLPEVDLYNPGTHYYNFTFPNTYNPALTDSGPLNVGTTCGGLLCGSGHYQSHFRPDHTLAGLANILRAFGTSTTKIDSTYIFPGGAGQGVKAGDDISICHVTTTGGALNEPYSCATTAINDSTHVITPDTPTTTVTLQIHTDVAWTGGLNDGANGLNGGADDDPSQSGGNLATDVHQIFLRTNGNITDTELVGSLLAGSIDSTNGDVTLLSPNAILDANGQTSVDVQGRNINMTAGTGGVIGGVGAPGNFLEIQVNADGLDGSGNLGVLTVNDITAPRANIPAGTTPSVPSSGTWGVFITQINANGSNGDMEINTIKTNGDASLTTTAGSIRDARGGGATGPGVNTPNSIEPPNVVANNVDLNALGGSVGDASGLDDLKVYSSANLGASGYCNQSWTLGYQDANYQNATNTERTVSATCHLAAQADASVFITETPGSSGVAAPMDVLLAWARSGNVRLTTTETGADGNGAACLNAAPTFAGQNAACANPIVTAGNDIALIHSGTTLVTENSLEMTWGAGTGAATVYATTPTPFGLIEAQSGNVDLVSADDIVTDAYAQPDPRNDEGRRSGHAATRPTRTSRSRRRVTSTSTATAIRRH